MALVLAQMMNWDDMHDGNGSGWGWGWIVGAVFMLAILVIAVVLVVRLTRGPATSGGSPNRPTSAPEELLAERLARGEIDAAEYRERRDALRGT